jgi:hypothetical protein
MKNPAANLSGILELVPPSKDPLAPVYEAITNSLESILELKTNVRKTIEITLSINDFDPEYQKLDSVIIKDQGAGFDDESYKRFRELLDKSKGNHNRGTGRLQYLHRFKRFIIESAYNDNGNLLFRYFECDRENFLLEKKIAKSDVNATGTILHLLNFEPIGGDETFYQSLSIDKLVALLKTKFALRAYLDNEKGKLFPTLKIQYKYLISKTELDIVIDPSSLPKPKLTGSFEVDYKYPSLAKNSKIEWHNSEAKIPEVFEWAVFEFNQDDIECHGAFLCSKDIPVKSLPISIISKGAGFNGVKKITAFHGKYLDQPNNVSQAVDAFNIKRKSDIDAADVHYDLFSDSEYVYLDDIEEKAKGEIERIYEEISAAQEYNEKRKFELARGLGISKFIAKKVRVSPLDDDDTITAALYQREADFLASKSNEARALLNGLNSLDPTLDNYQEELERKSIEISAVLDEQNKEELSKYVVRRELVVTLLDRILNSKLDVQNKSLKDRKNRDKEGVIHDLIFKRKRSSGPNDLWILNEDYIHYDACSDVELKDVIDSKGEKLLKNLSSEFIESFGIKVNRRPDVFLFSENESCIIVEFKAADVDLSDYLNQMNKYCTLIANYGNKKYTSFFCYLIGEKINPVDLTGEYKKTPSGDWLNPRIAIVSHDSDRRDIGTAQLEIIQLSNIQKRAKRRNKSFSEKLDLDIGP